MNDTRTWIASILFLDIISYSKRPVDQQLSIKVHFNELVSKRISHLDKEDCIRLDTGDGVAICYLGDPEAMYSIAHQLRDDFASMQINADDQYEVKLGLNMGAIKIVEGINNERNCVGVGINDAERVMSFAGPNQLLVSKLYFDTITSLSAEYASLFNHLGGRSDKHNKIHEVYELISESGNAPGTRSSTENTSMPASQNALDPKAVEHITAEFIKYVGSSKSENITGSAISSSNSVADFCSALTNAIDSEDDRYEFKTFTKYYGYSGF